MQTYDELFFSVEKAYESAFVELIFELGIEALEENDDGFFVRDSEDLSLVCFAFENLAEKISVREGRKIAFSQSLTKKQNKDWIEEYKAGVEPILIDKIYIHTSWQEPKNGVLNVKIDPALAFGSGHHESTNSCVKFLQKYAKAGANALDLGCGSGILSIILAKLGCAVEACDTDELAVSSTLENAKLNDVNLEKIWLGSINSAQKKYDIIAANLIADIIFSLKNDLKSHLNDGGFLIISGILDKYEERIKENFKDLILLESLSNGAWSSFVYKKEKEKNE